MVGVGDLVILNPSNLYEGYQDIYVLWDRWDNSVVKLNQTGTLDAKDICIVIDTYLQTYPVGIKVFSNRGEIGWINESLLTKIN